jgi:signal transduction histidine kinase
LDHCGHPPQHQRRCFSSGRGRFADRQCSSAARQPCAVVALRRLKLTNRNEALVAAGKLRDAFVNHVSYELRTPLTNIIGFTQILAAEGIGPLNPKQKEYAGFITDSSRALLAMIDDILDLASIDAGALELQLASVDAAKEMRAAAAGVEDRLQEASVELRLVMTDGVDTFIADGRRVRQVLFNLLSNAINYSERGQTVTLAVQQRGDRVAFKVSDRGPRASPRPNLKSACRADPRVYREKAAQDAAGQVPEFDHQQSIKARLAPALRNGADG